MRLDSLVTQMTFIMDRIWLNAGLDLRTIHFRIVPTGDRKGLIELVCSISYLFPKIYVYICRTCFSVQQTENIIVIGFRINIDSSRWVGLLL